MSKWIPTIRQQEALKRTEFEILYGGARGGGKTDAGMAWLKYDVSNPRLRALVIRQNATDLNDWIARARFMYPEATFTGSPAEIKFQSGATIVLGHLADEKAYTKYQGHEYQRMLLEELDQIPTVERYLKLLASCRSTVQDLPAQVFATTNPGGIGHTWIKRRWQLRGIPQGTIVTQDEKSHRKRVFVPAKIDDNPYLMKNDPTYVDFLNSLPDGLREAWRDGSWDDYEVKGAYYSAAIAQAQREGRICRIPYNPALQVHTVWDLGLDDAMAILFVQRDRSGTYIVDSYENRGEGIPFYIKYLKDKEYIYGKHFAPFDINQKELTSGKTRQETAKGLGINFRQVPSASIIDGIERAKIMFSRLWIDNLSCEQFLVAIKNYRKEWDDKLLDYKPKPIHDWSSHFADCLRYMALVEEQMKESGENQWDAKPKEEVVDIYAMFKKI